MKGSDNRVSKLKVIFEDLTLARSTPYNNLVVLLFVHDSVVGTDWYGGLI
jgi:hypothetical protein